MKEDDKKYSEAQKKSVKWTFQFKMLWQSTSRAKRQAKCQARTENTSIRENILYIQAE